MKKILLILFCLPMIGFGQDWLKSAQEANLALEKKQNILSSIGINLERDKAGLNFDKYIKEKIVLNSSGEEVKGDAFKIDLSKELKKNKKDQLLPLYVANVEGEKKYIIPLRGKGLWGPIWGYISLNNDLNTVYRAVFYHKSETPGYGAEINQYKLFQKQFEGKEIFNGYKLVSITVTSDDVSHLDKHSVDGISGATKTSDGVANMLIDRLKMYEKYLKTSKKID